MPICKIIIKMKSANLFMKISIDFIDISILLSSL